MKVIIVASILLYVFLCIGCNKAADRKWEEATIDPAIAHDTVYHRLDKLSEIHYGFVPPDSSARRSSDVTYFNDNPDVINWDKYSRSNNCRAYFYKSDTLLITIGNESPFYGEGFTIYYKAKRFFVEPFSYIDYVIVGAPEPSYEVVYQNVSLNKATYAVGDSLYGSVDFKSIETTGDGVKRQHIGKGLFRAKIAEVVHNH